MIAHRHHDVLESLRRRITPPLLAPATQVLQMNCEVGYNAKVARNDSPSPPRRPQREFMEKYLQYLICAFV